MNSEDSEQPKFIDIFLWNINFILVYFISSPWNIILKIKFTLEYLFEDQVHFCGTSLIGFARFATGWHSLAIRVGPQINWHTMEVAIIYKVSSNSLETNYKYWELELLKNAVVENGPIDLLSLDSYLGSMYYRTQFSFWITIWIVWW